jgi:hypothetical protein
MATYTLAGFRAYALARGNDAPTVASDADANAALQRAFDYIRTRYVLRFLASYDEDAAQVTEAVYIAAQAELTTPGFWSATFTPAQSKVLTKVGSIQWTPIGDASVLDGDNFRPTSPAIEALLNPLTVFGMPAVMVV